MTITEREHRAIKSSDHTHHDTRPQVAADEGQQPLVAYLSGHSGHQDVVIDVVEGNRDTLPIPKTFPNRSPSSARATLSRVAPCGS
jgi:hypothetical protein